MRDHDYIGLDGLESYLAEFAAPAVPMNLTLPAEKPVAKAPAKTVSKAPVKAPAKAVAKPSAKPAAKPAVTPKAAPKTAAKSTEPSKAGLTKISIGAAQDILNKLGAKLKRDGLFGAGTAGAWSTASNAKKVDGVFDRASSNEAWVSPAAVSVLSSTTPAKPTVATTKATAVTPTKSTAVAPKTAARPTASGKPTEPSKTGLTKISVGEAQDVLNKLGAKLKKDGLFGPGTAKAWANAAKVKGADGVFDRASSNEAWIDPVTLLLLKQVKEPAKSLAPTTKATSSAKSLATTKSTEPSKTGLTKVGVGAAQDILNKLGAKLKRDGLFGPGTAKAWATASTAKKTDGVFDRAGPMEAWVDPKALAALSGTAGVKASSATTDAAPASATPTKIAPPAEKPAPIAEQLAAEQVVKQATTPVPVLMVQQAELMHNTTPAAAGKYVGVTESGAWDAPTERGFYILFGLKPPYDGLWKIALQTLASGEIVRLYPKQASEVQLLSKMWLDLKAKSEAAASAPPEPQQSTPEPQQEAAPTADAQRVAQLVSRSNVIVPVKVLQQALRQLFDLQREGKIPASPVLPLPQITGVWRQGADDVGLFLGWGDKLSEAVTPEDKEAIVSKLVFTAQGLSGLRGLRALRALRGLSGFGDVPAGNAIRLPADVASNIQSWASDYVAKTAQSQPQAPSDSSQVLLPSGGGQVALEPELITGRVPQTQAPALAPVYTPAPMPYQDQVQAPAPISLTPNIPTPAPQEYFTPAPAPIAMPAAAPSYEPAVPVATDLAPPGAPVLAPAMPAVVTASTAETGGIGLILGLLGVGALAVLAMKGKDEPKYGMQPKKKRRKKAA